VEVLLNEKVELPGSPGTERPHFQLTNGMVITPDMTLVATGRLPNVEGLGLKQVGLPAEGFIPVDHAGGFPFPPRGWVPPGPP
jgi:pyruvate/2-oxoglutarate dehydrogenase complex dihydrolipoamide dehydrogenase (E3) component